MLTQCPHCEAYFRIHADELGAADGRVQCGNCGNGFDALHNLHDDDLAPAEQPPARSSTQTDATVTGLMDKGSAKPKQSTYDKLLQATQSASDLHQAPDANVRHGSATGWVSGLLVLVGLFVAQYSWFHSDEIVERAPGLHGPMQWFCGLTGCAPPERRDVAALHVTARDIREHPRYKRVLLVNTTIRNDAQFQQRFPDLQLQLFDTAGAPVGGRRLTPNEYLDPSVDIPAGMGPGVPVHIVLEIAEPGKAARGFEIYLL